MKKLLTIIFLFIGTQGYGFFDDMWEDTSPYGSKFYGNDGDISYWLPKTTIKLNHLQKWYFYKGYSIGINHGDSFFISDEINGKLYQFGEEKEWKDFIDKHNLSPIFIRWHNRAWSLFRGGFSEGIFLDSMILFIVILLAPIVYWLIILPFMGQIRTTFTKIVNWVIAVLKWSSIIGAPILTISWLLGNYPQSF